MNPADFRKSRQRIKLNEAEMRRSGSLPALAGSRGAMAEASAFEKFARLERVKELKEQEQATFNFNMVRRRHTEIVHERMQREKKAQATHTKLVYAMEDTSMLESDCSDAWTKHERMAAEVAAVEAQIDEEEWQTDRLEMMHTRERDKARPGAL
jgi:hypothetical protein